MASNRRGGDVIEIEVPMTKVITVKLDYSLVQLIDKLWRSLGYSNRSDFIRDAINYYLAHLMEKIEPGGQQSAERHKRGSGKRA